MSRTLGTITNEIGGVAPPAGQYVVSLARIEDADGEFGPQYKWIYEVESVIHSNDDEADEFIGAELHGYSSVGLGPRHKARAWVEALTQRAMEPGENVDEDDLIGRKAVANVIAYKRNDGTEATKIATEGGIQPYKKKSKKKKPAPAPEPEPEESDDDDDDEDGEPF